MLWGSGNKHGIRLLLAALIAATIGSACAAVDAPTPTHTAIPTITIVATATPLPPTLTPSPRFTPVVTAVDAREPLPPTRTATATATPITPTATATPSNTPTATATFSAAELCDAFELSVNISDGATISVNNFVTIFVIAEVTGIEFTLTFENTATEEIYGLSGPVEGGLIFQIRLRQLPGLGDYTWRGVVNSPVYGEICELTGYFTLADPELTPEVTAEATAELTPEATASQVPVLPTLRPTGMPAFD